MSLMRFAGRALFSSYFVVDGVTLVTKPEAHADDIAVTVDRVAPAIQHILPPDAADRVPEDPRTWTRLIGIAEIVGGIAYTTGIGRRLGAWLLTLAAVPRVVAASNSGEKSDLLAPAALLGAAVIATQDTEGKPGIAWRARKSTEDVKRTGRLAALRARLAAAQGRNKVKDALN